MGRRMHAKWGLRPRVCPRKAILYTLVEAFPTMVNLRCSKCGSSENFLIETQDGRTLEVKGSLSTDRIMKTVHITCTYCNLQWKQVPVSLAPPADPIAKRVMH